MICIIQFKMMYWVKTPWWLKKLYPNLVWDIIEDTKTIYLTFDDGPIPLVTPWVLETLKQYQAKATFFCIGDNVVKHPKIFEDLKKHGHSIGNHTYNHLKGWEVTDNYYIENYKKCQFLTQTNLFRPPYGKIKRSQIALLKQQYPSIEIVMWDILSGDFDPKLSPEKCLKKLLKKTKSGSIIVFHDSLKAQQCLQYVLPKALDYWKNKGYSFKGFKNEDFKL